MTSKAAGPDLQASLPGGRAHDGRSKARGLRTARGFSLLECVIAVVVMSVGALGIGKLQLHLYAQSALARQRLEAASLARQKIEQLRATNPGSPASGTDTPTIDSNTRFDRQWAATAPPGASSGLRQVTVTVSWTERTGQPQALPLTTLIATTDPADTALLRLQLLRAAASQSSSTRHPDIPPLATNRGDGTSALRVTGGEFIYANDTGLVTAFCADPLLPSTPPECKPWMPAVPQLVPQVVPQVVPQADPQVVPR